jgi:hypothetical protein
VPRTKAKSTSHFKTSLAAALANVRNSLRRFGLDSFRPVTDIVLSSNAGGLDTSTPSDPGVAAWFMWEGEQRCIAVDRYAKLQDNLQAIHHIIEARRTELRHGGFHVARQTFKGFVALPAPKAWREVLGFTSTEPLTRVAVMARHRSLATTYHPDKPGGSAEKMAELNLARDRAVEEIS